MKKKQLFLLLLLLVLFAIPVGADYLNFGGTAGFGFSKVSMDNTKNNYEYLAGIDWQESDHSDHKMWFEIRNSNNESRGKILINRPGKGKEYFDTTAKNGHYYYLYASREHIFNPVTYVSGNWQPR